MSKYGIVNLIDKLFITITIFLIIYAWVNFYLKNLWITFILSIIFTGALVFVLFFFLGRKNVRSLASKKQIEEINKSFLNFRLLSKKNRIKIIKSILENDYVVTETKNGLNFIKDEIRHLVIFATHIEKISQNDLINLVDDFASSRAREIDIICNTISSNLNKEIFSDKKINFITKERLYFDYFEKYNIFPDETHINKNISKLKFKDIVKNMFVPAKAKQYFLCGVILIFSSLILPYHIYYLVFGSILLVFSLLSKILPKIMQNKSI